MSPGITGGPMNHARPPLLAGGQASQRSLHNAPIFRLLLKVAVNGTHQCDFQNFCGGFGSQQQDRCRVLHALAPIGLIDTFLSRGCAELTGMPVSWEYGPQAEHVTASLRKGQ